MPFVRQFQAATLAVGVILVTVAPAWAQSRTAPEATQHALDELANCRAQRRPECPTEPPTPSLTATSTLSPTGTSTPEPTEDPTVTPTPTPIPCWLTDEDLGDPDNGYIVFDDYG
ncbi:MAG: hypothetical protein JO318_06245, partial [Chloroflexi bacterium]|nr:hypothetical protein [Chloroflexota bacterium]